jgi:hypothetical protein
MYPSPEMAVSVIRSTGLHSLPPAQSPPWRTIVTIGCGTAGELAEAKAETANAASTPVFTPSTLRVHTPRHSAESGRRCPHAFWAVLN